jgi:hypothetical protein
MFLWRACKGIRRCQRGLVTVRKVGSRFVTVRGSVEQLGASSICL